MTACGFSQKIDPAMPQAVLKQFNESDSVVKNLIAESDAVIYRFFYLPTANHQRSFMLEIKASSSSSHYIASEADYRFKFEEKKQVRGEFQGKVSPEDTTKILLAVIRSEIFSLRPGEQLIEADDGGAYMISTQPFVATVIFEKTTRKGIHIVSRMESHSTPAQEAASAFKQIAEKIFAEVHK